MWTLACWRLRRPHLNRWLRIDARGGDGGVREELARVGMTEVARVRITEEGRKALAKS
jgi:hypothetical protein